MGCYWSIRITRWSVAVLAVLAVLFPYPDGRRSLTLASSLSVAEGFPWLDLGAVSPETGPLVVFGVIQLHVVSLDGRWDLTAATETDPAAQGAGAPIPPGLLSLAAHGSLTWIPLRPLPSHLLIDQPPTGPQGKTVTLDARFDAGWSSPACAPGEVYSTRITYAVSSGDLLVAYAWPQPFLPGAGRSLSILLYAPPGASTPFTVTVYDALGSRVRTLQVPSPAEGWITIPWDGTNDEGNLVASGPYRFTGEDGGGRLLAAGKLVVGGPVPVRGDASIQTDGGQNTGYPLIITIDAPPRADIGDLITIEMNVRNAGPYDIEGLKVKTILPSPFRPYPNWEGPAGWNVGGPASEFTWDLGRVEAGGRSSFKFACIVLPVKVAQVLHVTAEATGTVKGSPISASPVHTYIFVSERAFAGTCALYGHAFLDSNGNGEFDSGELPLRKATISMETGDEVITDESGRFLFKDVIPGSHSLALTPRDAGPTQHLLVYIPPSGTVRADFPWDPDESGTLPRDSLGPRIEADSLVRLSLGAGEAPKFQIEGTAEYGDLRASFGPSRGLEVSYGTAEGAYITGSWENGAWGLGRLKGVAINYTDNAGLDLSQTIGNGLVLSSRYHVGIRSEGLLRLRYSDKILAGLSADLTAELGLPSCVTSLTAGLALSPAAGTSLRVTHSFGGPRTTVTAAYRRRDSLDLEASYTFAGVGNRTVPDVSLGLEYKPFPDLSIELRIEKGDLASGISDNDTGDMAIGDTAVWGSEHGTRIRATFALTPHTPKDPVILASYLVLSEPEGPYERRVRKHQFSLSAGFEPDPMTPVSYRVTGVIVEKPARHSTTLTHAAAVGRRLSEGLLLRLVHIWGTQRPTEFTSSCTMIECEGHISDRFVAVLGYALPRANMRGDALGFPGTRPEGPYLELALRP